MCLKKYETQTILWFSFTLIGLYILFYINISYGIIILLGGVTPFIALIFCLFTYDKYRMKNNKYLRSKKIKNETHIVNIKKYLYERKETEEKEEIEEE